MDYTDIINLCYCNNFDRFPQSKLERELQRAQLEQNMNIIKRLTEIPMPEFPSYMQSNNNPERLMKSLIIEATLKDSQIKKFLEFPQKLENAEVCYDCIFPNDPIKKWATNEEARIEKNYEYLKQI